jgi:hypothetical protein
MAQDWISITYGELQNAWIGFLEFIPRLLGALIIFIIGWLLSVAIGQIITRVLEKLKLNRLFEKAGWKEALEKAEFKINPAEFIGAIFKWILVIIFLLIAVEILGFVQFASFLKSVINWLPNLVVAIAIFVVAAIGADILSKVTVASLEKAKVNYSQFAGKIVRWSIWSFALLAILFQLGVARPLIETLFTGLIVGLALAFGIAFGLGGKDLATDVLKSLREKVREK